MPSEDCHNKSENSYNLKRLSPPQLLVLYNTETIPTGSYVVHYEEVQLLGGGSVSDSLHIRTEFTHETVRTIKVEILASLRLHAAANTSWNGSELHAALIL